MKNNNLKRWHIVIIVIGIIFISLGAFHTNTWFDENYSLGLANHSLAEIWTIGGNDVHPVLYYWCLRIVALLTGGSIIAYRIFSIIPIAIMIILGYTHIKKDFGEKTGLIFSFLSAFLPVMALYAVEIRMYSWAILTVTILAIYTYRLLKEDNIKNWIIFGLSSLASIYLHYYGLMAAGLINVALLIYLIVKKRKKGLIFIISFGIVQALAYLPWLVSLVTQMGNVSKGFWISFSFPKAYMEILSSQLVGYIENSNDYKDLIIPTFIAIGLYGYMFYKSYRLRKQKQNINAFLWSVVIYIAVILSAVIITKILESPILYYRYLFVITGLYIFAISFILANEKNNAIVITILSIIILLGGYNNIKLIENNYSDTNSQLIDYIQKNIQDGDTIIYTNSSVGRIATNHFKENRIYFYNKDYWTVEEAYKAFGPNFETFTNTDFVDECSNRVWVIEDGYLSSLIDNIFENTQYEIVEQNQILIKYHNYFYRITLLEN